MVLDETQRRIIEARHHDPFGYLGCHPRGDLKVVHVHLPGARSVHIVTSNGAQEPLERLGRSDLFSWQGSADTLPKHYLLSWVDRWGVEHEAHDPYSFGPQLLEFDLALFAAGKHWHAYRFLGAHCREIDGISGVFFAVWAPNAERVSVVGDHNAWDGRHHPLRCRGASGVWELFIPGLAAGLHYKFEIRARNGAILLKSDPYAQGSELRPATASVVREASRHQWQDAQWLDQRQRHDWLHAPLSIYEVHLGSWRRDEAGHFLNYRDLAHGLVDYIAQQGYTHLQLLPITEHPFDGSWGYQSTGYFCPTRRFGEPDELRYLVDLCHRHGIGVLLDWVPAHFPRDGHALAWFDGSNLYEHADPRRGEHRDWGTLIFDYGRNEVRNFLLSSALYWIEEFHIDGLRVDAVASMLYLDYSRQPDDWLPNIHGGNENLEAIDFLKHLNGVVHERFPGVLMMAEESTAWPMVSRPVHLGGLGFSMKWNMGWMNDTLDYIGKDPIHRLYHHDKLTFGLLYAFTENFILPFSHDEVVHGKRSLLYKMPGDEWQRFASLRLLLTYQFTQPGKKLNFMTNDIAQGREWNHDRELEWYLLQYPFHQGVQRLVADLNRLYRNEPALHRHDFDSSGFEWIDCHDSTQSVLSFLRKSDQGWLLVLLNFTPVVREDYRVGVPAAGSYRELFNSNSRHYGGSDLGNGQVVTEPVAWMGRPVSLRLTLPPLAGIVLRLA